MKRFLSSILLAAAVAVSGGCQSKEEPPPTVELPPKPLQKVGQLSYVASSRDAAAVMPFIYQVDVYLLAVPPGTISGNEAFWKRIDEQCVDPATGDLLLKNGIRVGEAPISELGHFGTFMEEAGAIQKFTMTAVDTKDLQIDMKMQLPWQNLFVYNRQNIPIGTTYDGSDNIMNIAFEPTPRKPGHLRLTLCPMVRATRKRSEFTRQNDVLEWKIINPERLYDVNFKVDLPRESFLIVAPSVDSARRTSLGNAFFIKDTAAERKEQVMIIISQPMILARPAK